MKMSERIIAKLIRERVNSVSSVGGKGTVWVEREGVVV